MGMILASFQSEGKIFEEMDVLKIQQSNSAINGPARFTRRQGILSSPVALFMGRFLMRTFDKETSSNWNEQVTRFVKGFGHDLSTRGRGLYRINIIVSLSIFRHNFVYCFPDLLGIASIRRRKQLWWPVLTLSFLEKLKQYLREAIVLQKTKITTKWLAEWKILMVRSLNFLLVLVWTK